jgi:hypothetical protein
MILSIGISGRACIHASIHVLALEGYVHAELAGAHRHTYRHTYRHTCGCREKGGEERGKRERRERTQRERWTKRERDGQIQVDREREREKTENDMFSELVRVFLFGLL